MYYKFNRKVVSIICALLLFIPVISNIAYAESIDTKTTFTQAFPDEKFRKEVKSILSVKEEDDNFMVEHKNVLADEIILDIEGRGISSLEGLEYFKSIQVLNCSKNNLTKLSLDKNPTVLSLYCSDNKLDELDVSECLDLQYIDCTNNNIETLDVSGLTKLDGVDTDVSTKILSDTDDDEDILRVEGTILSGWAGVGLIGVVVLVVIGGLAYFYFGKRKKLDKEV